MCSYETDLQVQCKPGIHDRNFILFMNYFTRTSWSTVNQMSCTIYELCTSLITIYKCVGMSSRISKQGNRGARNNLQHISCASDAGSIKVSRTFSSSILSRTTQTRQLFAPLLMCEMYMKYFTTVHYIQLRTYVATLPPTFLLCTEYTISLAWLKYILIYLKLNNSFHCQCFWEEIKYWNH